jgi:hypothetical protein
MLERVAFCKGNGGGVRLCIDPLLWSYGGQCSVFATAVPKRSSAYQRVRNKY